ncbi:MAG TPA: pyridoxal-dependent decarboxylase [Ignavibacteriaceae bacterium]|nr:pyridoxal-dependent decarboxylase [Ignavibacteriaceae bacterium]
MEKSKNIYDTTSLSDMPPEEFRKYGYELIDWVTEYLKDAEKYPPLSQVNPGDVKKRVPAQPPSKPEQFSDVLNDVDKIIMPGMTHWNHPNFMAYFNSTASAPGILAELLSSAFNINGMLWKSSPASTELEQVTLDWFRQMLSLPEYFWGIIYDTASVSSMHAIAAAREKINIQVREKGLAGRSDIPRLRLYCSEHAHSSIDKGALTIGLGLEGIRKISVDNNFKMIPEKLSEAINEDRKNGWLPFCVVATVGTTSTTSIDPVPEISKICQKEKVWLHVDAAHAGVTAMLPEMKNVFDGVEFADSLVVNPHKWMFIPIDLSVLYTKHKDILKKAFSLVAEYLKTGQDSEVENYMDYGIQLGRRFRSLKLWFVIRYFGIEGIQNILREHLRLGKLFAGWIDEHPEFERMAPTPFSTTCFRANPGNLSEKELDFLNENLMNKVNETGKLFITHTKLNNKFVIRLVVSGIRTKEKHVKEAWKLIQKFYSKIK